MELIDRDVLRDKITQRIIEEDTEFPEYDWGTGLSIAKDILDRMPTVKAVPVRHGTWRHYERMLTCSECGTVFDDDIMEYFGEEVPKYCPECGARMDL